MRISLGILAWNEASSIGATIDSIFAQRIFHQPPEKLESIEIAVVPNGCTDATAEVAQQALDRAKASIDAVDVRVVVHNIAKPSKANAWNMYVHEVSDPQADFLILMDGDVKIQHPDTLGNMVQALNDHPQANVAGAVPVKHLAMHKTRNMFDWLSLGASEIRREMPGCFAGCLYCTRASILRQFRLPSILIGEDIFVRATIVTDFFTREENMQRVVTAPNATVLFEAYTSPRRIFKNLKRRAVTMAIDAILFSELWDKATPKEHGGALLIRWDREQPGWDRRLLEAKMREEKWRTDFVYHYRKWWERIAKMPKPKALMLIPAVMAAGSLDTAASYAAHRAMRRGEVSGLWFNTRTKLS